MKIRKVLALLLSLTMIAAALTSAPFSASAAQTEGEAVGAKSGTTGNCKWSLNGTVLTISGNGRMKDYNYFYDSPAPWGREVTKVIINYGVTYIGKDSFYLCEDLTEVYLADGTLTEIGESAFESCYHLESITVPESVETIGPYAFGRCVRLTDVTLPKNLTTLSYGTFYSCNLLAHIELPDTLTDISWELFRYCYSLESIRLPSNLQIVNGYAFSACTSLKSIDLPESVKIIGESAFKNCRDLAEIDIKSGVDTFGNDSFEGTAWLNNRPDGPVYVNNCLIDWHGECPAQITVKNGTKKIYGMHNQEKLEKVTIPATVTEICNSAFKGCSALSDAAIPNGVTRIGSSAFADCTSITSVYLPDSVTSVGNSTFSGCTAMEELRLSENIIVFNAYSDNPEAGGGAFNNCTSLTSLILPKKLRLVSGAFNGCTSLKKVLALNPDFEWFRAFYNAEVYKLSPSTDYTVELDGNVLTVSGSGAMTDYSAESPTPLPLFPELSDQITSVVIGEGITSVGDYSFAGFKNLKSVSLPSTVTRIGANAFEDCVSLKELPDLGNVTYLGAGALDNTAWLNAKPDGEVFAGDILYGYKGECPDFLQITGKTRVVAAGALNGSQTLESVEIGGDPLINGGAFSGCPNLAAAGFLTASCVIESGAFADCPNLVFYCDYQSTAHTYAKENKITFLIVGGDIGTCRWSYQGTKLIIYGNGSIPSGKGPWSDNVTEIILGKGVTKVGSSAFSNLTKLQKLVVQSRTTSFDSMVLPLAHKMEIYCYPGSTAESKFKSGYLMVTLRYLGEKGDANIDGAVNIEDATFLQRCLAEYGDLLLSLEDEDVLAQGDTNGDGKLNVKDITEIQRYLAGVIEEFA